MFIKTQSGELIINGNYICKFYIEADSNGEKKDILCGSTDGIVYKLGSYSTSKRAEEVFDILEQVLRKDGYSFQMPKE